MQLGTFTELRVAPLTRAKALALIGKLEFDADVKRNLSEDLRSPFFDQYESLLSNPLLLNLMLIKYSDSGRGSKHRSDYFAEVFEAMWSRHDTTKGLDRKRYVKLDRAAFLRVLESVAAATYQLRKFRFSQQLLLDSIERASAQEDVQFDSEDYTRDLLINVSLLVADGLDYTFIHRSFQEYLCARYLLNAPNVARSAVQESIYRYSNTDAVLDLANEMNPGRVKYDILVPDLARILQALETDERGEVRADAVVVLMADLARVVQWTPGGAIWEYKDVRRNIIKVVQRLYSSAYESAVARFRERWDRLVAEVEVSEGKPGPVYHSDALRHDFDRTIVLARASADAVQPEDIEFAKFFLDSLLEEYRVAPRSGY